jgi:ElaA protein
VTEAGDTVASGHHGATTTVRAASFAELDTHTLHAILRLRVDVFVVEQACAYPELDGRDVESATAHLWTADDAGPTSYLRVLDDGEVWRIGRVCTRADSRGSGLAAALMAATLGRFTDRPVVLDAQAHLAGWYERFGFHADGAEFLEDGIPHIPMRRELTAQGDLS